MKDEMKKKAMGNRSALVSVFDGETTDEKRRRSKRRRIKTEKNRKKRELPPSAVPLSIREPTTPDRTPDPDADHTRALCQGKELLLLLRGCLSDGGDNDAEIWRGHSSSPTWEMEFLKHG